MTIKELINILKKYDEDKQVYIMCNYDDGFGIAGGNCTEIFEKENYIALCSDE